MITDALKENSTLTQLEMDGWSYYIISNWIIGEDICDMNRTGSQLQLFSIDGARDGFTGKMFQKQTISGTLKYRSFWFKSFGDDIQSFFCRNTFSILSFRIFHSFQFFAFFTSRNEGLHAL